MKDFVSGRTTVTSRYENVSSLEPPTITVCVNPRFKRSVALEYGMDYSWSSSIPASNESKDTTYGERFAKLSYILNQDYRITIALIEDVIDLELGKNVLDDNYEFEVKEIQTALHGTCIVIIPKFMITVRLFFWKLILKPSSDLEQANEISKFIIYLTSYDSWHSIVSAEWPQYNPSVIKVHRNSRYFYPAKVTEYLYAKGNQNSKECMTESIKNSDCLVKCSVGSLANLPKCNTTDEVDCIWLSNNEALTECNQRKRGLTFDGDLEKLENYVNGNDKTIVEIFVNAFTKKVHEEVDIITTSGFIGSVGGSLGMFFGFSISGYALNILDSITRRFNT